MAGGFGKRLAHAFNVFRDKDVGQAIERPALGSWIGSQRPHISSTRIVNKNSLVIPIYNRIAIDVSTIEVKHVRLDENDRYLEDIKSYLNECLTLDTNIDQTSRAFFLDAAMQICENGAIAIVPVQTTINPRDGLNAFDVKSLRVGKITQWYPKHVAVNVYNEETGQYEEVTLSKKFVAIVENPLYAVMNESNSLLQRLIRKLSLLDTIDENTNNGKLDLIIQLPYPIKTEARREEAKRRKKEVVDQLKDSEYGIVYTDGTERITQLNRPAENNLLAQIEYLTKQLYGQLGITEEVINGTADEATMINYHNRTVEPILSAMVLSMRRTFLTKTARTQGQSIEFYRDPFKLVPLSQIAEIADKFTRNEIASSNDIRTEALGWKPSKDPKADELRNSNLNQAKNVGEDIVDAEIVEDGDQKQIGR